MDYTSLKEITQIIIGIIQKAVDESGNWHPQLKVLPEILRDQNKGIGFYLFHVQESSHYKNFPAPGNDNPPVSHTPMALNLFYQLSANSTKESNEEDAYDEQVMMSVAMKALHDNSVIKIAPSGKKIDIKITLQTLTPSESVQYWAASESPVRLSAYYEVSVVFLVPEEQKSYAGRVLSYGNFIFVKGAPQITSSESTIEYTLPGETTARQVKIKPAQAPLNSIVSFYGTGFNGGSLKVLLISPLWSEAVFADATWLPTLVSENQLNLTLQPTATRVDGGGTVDIIPGLYAAQISITEERTLPNGTTKTFNHVSNQFPFSVMPRVTSITPLGGGAFNVGCEVFQHPAMTDDDLQVYIGVDKLLLSSTAPSAGKYRITSATTIELKVPAGLPPGQIPLRILIRGIESEPRWITIA
ncbi:MAG: Pvc16 family protein [Aequorivita sp.]